MTSYIQPGLLVLHGNRSELLGDAVFEWIRRQPLQPLEEEVFLVQSNGVAEWVKMALAKQSGICAATRVELPGRFLWRAYRQILGRDAVPARSSMDKLPLTWRLMKLLPDLITQPGYEPLAGFLRLGGLDRRLQLAQRLADLYDQYQVYRSDWLQAWGQGNDILPNSVGASVLASSSMPVDQLWQAALWRELLASLDDSDREAIRPQLHQRFMAALNSGAEPAMPIARRVVLFCMTHIPMETLQALAALSQHCQVLLAIPNPCRYHWADIIQGRELLQMERRRQPLRKGVELANISLEGMHIHSHPLLAAWGRQGRDFVRQLDAFDDVLASQKRFALSKVDLFDEGPGKTLLEQIQANIRDLVPLAEHPAIDVDPADRSIMFHVAHGSQREVEILHDQLLEILRHPIDGNPLNPRDVVVMVPDIDVFAPSIRSVFGQYSRGDPRFIPFDIADQAERGNNPLLMALDWLLRLPQQRCCLTEIRDLLDVPAVAQRFGLKSEDLPRLIQWIDGAGIRWGLNSAQRSELGLATCGEQNTWLFGLRRMLLGYATGDGSHGVGSGKETGCGGPFRGIQPYSEVGGLDAALVGSLVDIVDALVLWLDQVSGLATPMQWAERGRNLIESFIDPIDDRGRLTVTAMHAALQVWLDACDAVGFDEPISLQVVREAWLGGIDEPTLNSRFRAGGVTFCTLVPMRAIPFEVVCLMGMNDGDYPRSSSRSDFDLMGLPGQMRPGDRSRRDDDRQLMLEALLSARRLFYISWSGRSARDNSEQPPSVLVSQLREYIKAGWGGGVLPSRTTEHPLQPFSRRYFEKHAATSSPYEALFTHAREWRNAHSQPATVVNASQPAVVFEPNPDVPLTVAMLTGFLKNPVKDFFRRRLDVVFRGGNEVGQDNEAFAIGGLDEYVLLNEVAKEVVIELQTRGRVGNLSGLVAAHMSQMQRAGRLPMAELGQRTEHALVEELVPMLVRWCDMQELYPEVSSKHPLRFVHDALVFDDWLVGLRSSAEQPLQRVWLELLPSKLCIDKKCEKVRIDKLLTAWVRTMTASACGIPVQGVIVGRDATVIVNPMPKDEAVVALKTLMNTWREGMTAPLPLASKTAVALLEGKDPAPVYEGSQYAGGGSSGEVEDECLSRMYPDYTALNADGRFMILAEMLFSPIIQWTNTLVKIEPHGEPTQASNHD